jgi:cyclase
MLDAVRGWSAPRLRASLLGALAATTLNAQVPAAYPSVLSYRTVKVAAGVYAFITPEERSGWQAGNSIAIIGDDGVLVFDTGNIPGSTRRQIADIRKLTDKPVRYVVNSHWHPDHNLGNTEYRKAFPGVIVIGTTATRDGILQRVPAYIGQMKAQATTDSLMRLRLSTGKMRDGSPMPDNVRKMWTVSTRDYAEFLPEVSTAVPSTSDMVFDDSLTLWLGTRRVKLVSPGRGNTAGDIFAVIPDAGVLLTGDLVTVPCPFPSTSYFSEWISALDRLAAVKATAIVPGHGDVQPDYDYVTLTRELLAFTREEARAAVRNGVPLDTLQKRIDFEPWIKRFSGGDTIRVEVFNGAYRNPAVERAFEEAKFESQGALPSSRKP